VLLSHPNAGFDIAQPVGLAVASVFAVASCLPFHPDRPGTFRALVVMRTIVAAALVAWAVVSLADLPPLNHAPSAKDVEGSLVVVAVVSVALYLIAAVRFYLLHRRSPAAVLLSLVTAFVLLAESMVAVTLAPKWHLSVVGMARSADLCLRLRRLQRVRPVPPRGLERRNLRRRRAGGDQPTHPGRVRRRAGGTRHDAAGAGAQRHRGRARRPPRGPARRTFRTDRGPDRGARPGRRRAGHRTGTQPPPRGSRRRREQGLVALDDSDLLDEVLQRVRPAYGDVAVSLVSDGRLTVDGHVYDPQVLAAPGPHEMDGRYLYPLWVKGRVAGVLSVPSPSGFRVPPARADDPLVATLATQLSITLENARLYRELGTLFRQYMSPDVAAALWPTRTRPRARRLVVE
jgi:hypothetical protein